MAKEQPGVTGDVLLQLLERRLDNVVYRLSFAESRPQGRQLVNHGHFTVNGKRVNIPSYLVKPGDSIEWKRSNGNVQEFVQTLTEGIPSRPVPSWLQLDPGDLRGQVESLPIANEANIGVDARLIVEFYSR